MRAGLVWRYALGVAALRPSDVLLASFPRSGSTLLRFLVTHYALEAAGDASAVPFERLNRLAPELGVAPLFRPAPLAGVPRLVKTHRPYALALARPRTVLLVRSPLDALASYHRYWTAREGAEPVERSAFLRDARRGLPRWVLHTRSWTPRADWTIRYQDLRTDPSATLDALLTNWGVSVDAGALARAVERSEAPAVRALERSGGVAGSDRLRAGTVFAAGRPPGSGQTYFADADRAWAHDQLIRAGLGAWAEDR